MKKDQKKCSLEIIDYNLMWFNNNIFPCDGTTWFLFKKK